jgi:hypothetical protein
MKNKISSRWNKAEALRRGARDYSARAGKTKDAVEARYFLGQADILRNEANRHVSAAVVCGDVYSGVR